MFLKTDDMPHSRDREVAISPRGFPGFPREGRILGDICPTTGYGVLGAISGLLTAAASLAGSTCA